MNKKTALTFLLSISLLVLDNSFLYADAYYGPQKIPLEKEEQKGIALTQKWQQGSKDSLQPFSGIEGEVSFVFGVQEPKVICAPIRITDITLQEGENISAIHLGDTARWNVDTTTEGIGPTEKTHILIKPLDSGLQTNMVIITDRRDYHISLKSTPKDYISKVSFIYPECEWKKALLQKKAKRLYRERKTIPETGEYLGNLDFNYVVYGKAAWKPIRVYNDGRKTIIQMPSWIEEKYAPVLLEIERDGSLVEDTKTRMVNYRLKGDRYIVDDVFDKAMLVEGVGRYQNKIIIERR